CLLWQHPREAIHLLCDLVRRCEQTVQGNGRCEGGENCEQRVQGQACRNQRRIVLARLLLDPEKDVAPPTGGYVARAAGVTAARGVLIVSDGSGHSSNLPRDSSPRGCNMYARRSGVGEHQPFPPKSRDRLLLLRSLRCNFCEDLSYLQTLRVVGSTPATLRLASLVR